ncbi:hypothetical protein PHYC_00097 [Phycisphaerales bacterium]|nr:hypothetical protein PHYC_00097 [Phycisphaerales bacterium]
MRYILLALAAGLTSTTFADVRPARVFTDNAVLQHNASVPIWGWADPGEKVLVNTPWLSAPKETSAGADGRWEVRLDTPAADGKPFEISISGSDTVVLKNLLLGEVWVCSGQSNMEWPLRASANGEEAVNGAVRPTIRLFNVNNKVAARPSNDVDSPGWQECSPASAANFSAVGYYFAVSVGESIGVPIGMIETDWGGTPAESWTSLEMIRTFSEFASQVEFLEALDPDPNVRASRTAKFAGRWWDNLDTSRGAPGKDWAQPEFDDSSWGGMKIPSKFSGDLAQFDGVLYLRCIAELPESCAGQEATLSLGPIDDRDDAYVNGVRIGGTRDDGRWNSDRRYKVPGGLLKAGRNVIAVRVVDTGGLGGVFGDAGKINLTCGEAAAPLAGEWKFVRGPSMANLPPIGQGFSLGPHTATGLHNAMIRPLAPYRIAGAIWYQGESNRGNADLYRRLFPAMIADWRRAWGQGDFPFYFVQIAPFNYGNDRGETAALREAQAGALSTPNTGMVVTMDIGNPTDIHPTNKRDVGERLARWALAKTYSRTEVVCASPRYQSMRVDGNAIDVGFDLAGSSALKSSGGAPTYFAIAGDDRVFHVADAEIASPDKVRVSSPKVPKPVAVRYAYESACAPNLFNAEGLPAAPFRTDAWERPAEGWAPAVDAGRTTYLSADPEFIPLFNGKDLSGWVNVNCAPATWTVVDGMIHCTGAPTGVLRTAEQYENFVLELEWRHLSAQGNAGLFVWSDAITAKGVPFTRSVEVQVMTGSEGSWYTSDGDVFPIHGAKMTPLNPRPSGGMRSYPTEKRMNPSPQWNHYRVECNNGSISLAVNGKVVTQGKDTSPRTGFICLESEGTPIDFRNLVILKLPSSSPPPPETGMSREQGFEPLYTGVDFDGWKFEPAHEGHFKANDWTITFDGQGGDLWSSRSYRDFVLIADWRWTEKPVESERPIILSDGTEKHGPDGKALTEKIQDAGDSGIYLRGSSKSQVNLWCWGIGSGEVYGYRTDASMPPEVRAGVTPKEKADAPPGEWNRTVITMKGDRLTVVLNDRTVIENALLPGVQPEGPIALQSHGSPIQFANLLIKELK